MCTQFMAQYSGDMEQPIDFFELEIIASYA